MLLATDSCLSPSRGLRLAQMAPDDEDALSRAIQAQHISYESVPREERQLSERVRKLFYNELMMFSIFILS